MSDYRQDNEGRSPLLQVKEIKKHFAVSQGVLVRRHAKLKAVDGVSFDIQRGETLGLVGESGCGKSTVARLVTRLLPLSGGQVLFEGRDIFGLTKRELRPLRRHIQMVFQDPYSSLDARMSVGDIVSEPWVVHNDELSSKARRRKAAVLLERVGLSSSDVERFPHEFSGGQKQRIGIARALATGPDLIVCDEPVSALDVSVQAQVINLLEDLQGDLGIAYLFIAHDLSVVRHISDRVAVMYLGRIVEIGDTETIYERPTHPYTQALLSAAPVPDPAAVRGTRIVLEGDVPSPINPPSGCTFRTRCWKAESLCAEKAPILVGRGPGSHESACHFAGPAPEVAGIGGT